MACIWNTCEIREQKRTECCGNNLYTIERIILRHQFRIAFHFQSFFEYFPMKPTPQITFSQLPVWSVNKNAKYSMDRYVSMIVRETTLSSVNLHISQFPWWHLMMKQRLIYVQNNKPSNFNQTKWQRVHWSNELIGISLRMRINGCWGHSRNSLRFLEFQAIL